MGNGIFLIQTDGSLVEMPQSPYNSEEVLQDLLAKYPNILTGNQNEDSEPSRWLLVKQEMGVPDNQFVGNRWSLDHLFLDQNGIPTLVEVKRATDTRIRREVVGQMLDYAANALVYWPIDKIRENLEQTLLENDEDEDDIFAIFLEDEINREEFWKRVETNLRSGRVRLIFIADAIPRELRRIIEFLNQQMSPAEVFGIEVRRYEGHGMSSLVPSIVGVTTEAEIKKSSSKSNVKQWDEVMFIEALEERGNENEVTGVKQILRWAYEKNLRVWWGKGEKAGSFYVMYDKNNEKNYTFCVTTGYKKAYIQLQFQYFKEPFIDFENKRALADKIEEATNSSIPDEKLEKFPSIAISNLDRRAIDNFLNVFDWYLDKLIK